jgi:hypothetical protein
MKRIELALGFSLAIAMGAWFVPKGDHLSAASNGGTIRPMGRDPVPGGGVGDPTPGSPSYGWWQFASFLKSQSQSGGVIGPAGFPTPADFDSDWAGVWMNKSQLNLGTPPCSLGGQAAPERFDRSALEYPVQLRVPIRRNANTPPRARNAGTCQGIQQLVLYNATASNDIKNRRLDLVTTLQALLSSGTSIRFDDHSIIVKELWEPIAPGQSRISVWQPGNRLFTNPAIDDTYGDITGWPTIRIDAAAQAAAYVPTVSASISAFAHTAIGGTGAALPAYVLVGVNIAHKVNGTWYWFAFSWADAPSGGTTGQAQCSSSWNQYCMNMTSDPAGRAICFNPYLEGQQPNGLFSNCVRCHQFAAYPKQEMEGISTVNGSNRSPVSPAQVRRYMQGAISTDSLWSLISHLPGQQLQ